MVKLDKVAKDLEAAYQKEKDRECEALHNAIAEVLQQQKATVQNTLFVLDLIKFELTRAKYEQYLGNVQIPNGSVPVSTGKTEPKTA